tara:strand:+ start:58 stop:519 length:462 start_codon:yes stop_codon:yes gene_type:complete
MRLFSLNLTNELEIVARWCLWLAGLLALPTALLGLYAYNTVSHDAPSHMAMTTHRNWALPTATLIMLVSAWSLWRYFRNKTLTVTFLLLLIITQGMLLTTAWLGGELVYRYGLGVMSLPQQSAHDGHNHTEGMDSDAANAEVPEAENHDQHNH